MRNRFILHPSLIVCMHVERSPRNKVHPRFVWVWGFESGGREILGIWFWGGVDLVVVGLGIDRRLCGFGDLVVGVGYFGIGWCGLVIWWWELVE